MKKKTSGRTIADFGEQWTNYTENTGYYASAKALGDLLSPLMSLTEVRGKKIADVGAGTGRYTQMLHAAGAQQILAAEPSRAYEILLENTAGLDGVTCLNTGAEQTPPQDFDLIFCIGVLQFIPDPRSALMSMGRALSRSGRLFLWVYGAENNRLYLTFLHPLRQITRRLPHRALDMLSGAMEKAASLYALLCRCIRLPLADYMNNYYSGLNSYSRKLVIYDQLNPSSVKYYYKEELKKLLEECGFTDIRMHHRLNYSWSVLARYRHC
ncbi:MAG: class I SAM-dependent methyltransferase [Desulfobacterales bacterium]